MRFRITTRTQGAGGDPFSWASDDFVTEGDTVDDAIDYTEWWRDRVISDDVAVKSANKDIGQLSRMLKDVSIRRRLNIPGNLQRPSSQGADRTLAHAIRH